MEVVVENVVVVVVHVLITVARHLENWSLSQRNPDEIERDEEEKHREFFLSIL